MFCFVTVINLLRTKLTHDSNLISIISSQKYKEYLVEGKYTALEYVRAIGHTAGSLTDSIVSDFCSDNTDNPSVSTLEHNIMTTNM